MDFHRSLIERLTANTDSPLFGPDLQVIETHISTVVLTGDHAFKFKKPVNFGFLDFSTLEARKHFCAEEIRLNQRLAPSLYLETVAITGTADAPALNGEGDAIEYAVKMCRFDQSALFDSLLRENKLGEDLIIRIADSAAAFHASAAVAAADSDFAKPETIFFPMQQNFDQLRELITDLNHVTRLNLLEKWTQREYETLQPALKARGENGAIRECHGDMHLGNITLYQGDIAIFDGIEFNEHFRWIDVMSEMAFITMDLTDRGAGELAMVLLNRYLEQTGDYEGVPLLRFYQVYRAMVRAKIASFRLADPALSDSDREQTIAQFLSYIDLAERFSQPVIPRLGLMFGVSGSGKSWLSQQLANAMPAIRIRSDVERKRLFGNGGDHAIDSGIYTPEATLATYDHLLKLAETLLAGSWQVLVDAAFLRQAQREPFECMAANMNVKCMVIATLCDEATMRERITHRSGDPSDATVEVMEHQLRILEMPRFDENGIEVDCRNELNLKDLIERIQY